jgi:hypothetical protein
MSRTVIVILIYHRHKPVDLVFVQSYSRNTGIRVGCCSKELAPCHVIKFVCTYRSDKLFLFKLMQSKVYTLLAVSEELLYNILFLLPH